MLVEVSFVVVGYTLPGRGEEYFLIWTQIRIYCKADTFLHILLNAKHLSMFAENKI